MIRKKSTPGNRTKAKAVNGDKFGIMFKEHGMTGFATFFDFLLLGKNQVTESQPFLIFKSYQ